jgi:hypothetical protein
MRELSRSKQLTIYEITRKEAHEENTEKQLCSCYFVGFVSGDLRGSWLSLFESYENSKPCRQEMERVRSRFCKRSELKRSGD